MKNEYGRKLKKYRLDHYLTQEEFAKQLGIGVATLKRWEYGEFKPTLSIKQKIDDLLNYAPNSNVTRAKIQMYTDPQEQLVSLMQDFKFSPYALCVYLDIGRSELDELSIYGRKACSSDEQYQTLCNKIFQLYSVTFGLKDGELLHHVKTLINDYKFTQNSIATLADIPLHDLQNILEGKAGKVDYEVKYKLAVTLMTLKLMLPEVEEDIF